jgi:hypothetical protein
LLVVAWDNQGEINLKNISVQGGPKKVRIEHGDRRFFKYSRFIFLVSLPFSV